jgi:hypothetical protein
MKPPALLVLALGLWTAPLMAQPAEVHRTDINPALLYWQSIVLTPALSQEDRQYLSTNEFIGGPLNERLKTLALSYNAAFRVLQQAAVQTAPCDWGYDLTYGPTLMLPGLGKAKHFAQVERIRFRAHIENHSPADAVQEWLAVRACGHRLATDGTLISRLVHIAMDSIQLNTLAENWFRLDETSLRALQRGIELSPKGGTIAESFAIERPMMLDWFIRQIELIQQSTQNPAQRRQLITQRLRDLASDDDKQLPEQILAAAEGKVEKLIPLLRQLDPLYDQAAQLLAMPYDEFGRQLPGFKATLKTNTNPFVKLVFPEVQRSRAKEFTAECQAAVLKAALARRLDGNAAFLAVRSPLTGKPFEVRPVESGGKHCGFLIRSGGSEMDPNRDQIFLESDGPALHLNGPKIGTPY